AEQTRQVGLQAFAPVADAGVRHGQEAHEDVRAAHRVPAGLARQTQGLLQGVDGRLREKVGPEAAARLEDVIDGVVWGRHDTVLQEVGDPTPNYGRPAVSTQGSVPRNRPAGAFALGKPAGVRSVGLFYSLSAPAARGTCGFLSAAARFRLD